MLKFYYLYSSFLFFLNEKGTKIISIIDSYCFFIFFFYMEEAILSD